MLTCGNGISCKYNKKEFSMVGNNAKITKGSNNEMKIYTISGRKTEEVIDNTVNILIGNYQVNKEYMDDKDKINNLENIVDLIHIKEKLEIKNN